MVFQENAIFNYSLISRKLVPSYALVTHVTDKASRAGQTDGSIVVSTLSYVYRFEMSYESVPPDGVAFKEELSPQVLKEKIPAMRITKLIIRQKEENETLEEHVEKYISSTGKLQERPILIPSNTFDVFPASFEIKICTYTTSSKSELSEYIDKLTNNDSGEKQTIHYMILFFREVRSTTDPPVPQIEMYALTSGIAHTLLPESDCDEEFPKRIARRLLEFNLKSLSSKHLIGTHSSSSNTFRLNEGTELSFWDYLGHITTTFKMPFKADCSLFGVRCFQRKDGRPRKVSMTVGINYLRVHMKLSLIDMAFIIQQLSRIARGIFFKRFRSTEEEVDDNSFDILSHVELVKKKKVIARRDNRLKKDIIDSIKNDNLLKISLVHRKLEAWNNANRFSLLLKESSNSRPKKLMTWKDEQPLFSQIALEIKKIFPGDSLQKNDFDQLYLKFKDTASESKPTSEPLLQFVEKHVRTSDGKSFFRYCGKWLRIRTAYLSQLEVEFTNIERGCQVEQNILPLPWIYSEKNAGRDIKKKKSERERPTTAMDQKKFENWCKTVGQENPDAIQTKLTVNFDNYPNMDTEPLDCTKKLFYRMHCHQTEGMFNEGFLWYDRLARKAEMRYLLGDRILVKHVELYDILYFTPEKTYLIHVKEGLAEKTRDVCSQIRVSADLLFKNIICNSRFEFLEDLWRIVTRGKMEGYKKAVKQQYENVGKEKFLDLFKRDELVYVLAYRDHREDKNTAQFDNYPEKRLRDAFGKKFKNVKKELIRSGYLEKFDGEIRLTDKIYYTQEQAKQEIQLSSVSDGLKAFKILQEAMSKHPSFIAKIEIVHLYNHFKQLRTATPSKRMSLKLCRIPTELAC